MAHLEVASMKFISFRYSSQLFVKKKNFVKFETLAGAGFHKIYCNYDSHWDNKGKIGLSLLNGSTYKWSENHGDAISGNFPKVAKCTRLRYFLWFW